MKTRINQFLFVGLILLLSSCTTQNDQLELEKSIHSVSNLKKSTCEGTLRITDIWPSSTEFILTLNALACDEDEDMADQIGSWTNGMGTTFFFESQHDHFHFANAQMNSPNPNPSMTIEVTYPNGVIINHTLSNDENSNHTHVLCPELDWRLDCPGTDKD